MTQGHDTDNERIPGTIFTPRQAQILKIAVIVMGVMLIVGFLTLTGAMIYKASRLGKAEETSPVTPPSSAAAPLAATLDMGPGEHVQTIQLSGNRLVLHIQGPEGGRVLVLDMATRKKIWELRLVPAQKP